MAYRPTQLAGWGIVVVALTSCAVGTGADTVDLGIGSEGDNGDTLPSSGQAASSGQATGTGSGGNSNVDANGGSTSQSSSVVTTGAGGGVPTPPADMIDNLESGNGTIISQQGRVGSWFSYNDETPSGKQSPEMGTPFTPSALGYASSLAANTQGGGFTSWGAGMGFDLNNAGIDATTRQPYDLSGHTGITFWAKGDVTMRFMVATVDTLDADEGGVCSDVCDDRHGVAIPLTAVWTEHAVDFGELAQEGWGTPAPFDPTLSLAVQFQTAAIDHDIWIDDVSLY